VQSPSRFAALGVSEVVSFPLPSFNRLDLVRTPISSPFTPAHASFSLQVFRRFQCDRPVSPSSIFSFLLSDKEGFLLLPPIFASSVSL